MRSVNEIIKPPDSYRQQIESREWALRRRNFIDQNGHCCRSCRREDVPLRVHHINYTFGKHLAEYPDDELMVLCQSCHEEWTKIMRAYRRLFSFWNVAELKTLFGVLKVAKEKHGDHWPSMKLLRALQRESFI